VTSTRTRAVPVTGDQGGLASVAKVHDDLRRASATALVTAGVDLKPIQTRLGHSDPHLSLAVCAQATTAADLLRKPASLKTNVPWPCRGHSRPETSKAPYKRFSWTGRRDLNPRPKASRALQACDSRRMAPDRMCWSGRDSVPFGVRSGRSRMAADAP
jgi:hypothetical protein